ncbi:hypothetical protein KIW84_073857 [Lathyrus oleraceus]|uniref:Uncharacterized protein n=1 Tax=Pisum sativum TaxID=3888 RepID=A0A9D4VR33_PEA|nr:hypothetical protein KIW84_073857 [Pisum sativum]
MDPRVQSRPALAAVIREPLYVNDLTYILEPSMEDGRRNVWYNNALIPYSIASTIYAFMGPIPRCIEKPQILKYLFSYFFGYKPLLFMDASFDFNFLKNKVFHFYPPTKGVSYIQWLDKVQEKKKYLWRDLGIFYLIQLSRVGLKYNSHMLIASMCF